MAKCFNLYIYTYDNANNQKTKHEIIAGVTKGTTIYTYDVLNRLETITEPSGRKTSYTYDRAGNRLTETITLGTQSTKNTYLYNEQNRLMEITTRESGVLPKTTKFEYDNNGNQLTTTSISYLPDEAEPVVTIVASNTYDRLNQLVKTVTTDGSSIINTYNGEGLRVSKTSEGRTTYFLYEYDKVVLELYSSGAQKARNLYGTNLLMRTVGYESYYYLYNGHADVTALIDQNGSIEATYYYDAFGNIIEQTGDVNNSITYSGYQYDEETGLYYLNARMYDPKIARFLQEDTYRGNPNDPLSLNLYTYCHNNPIVYWDPTGHKSVPVEIDKYKQDLRYYNERLNSKDVCTYEKDYMLALKGKTENNLLRLIENSPLDLLEQGSEEYALKNSLIIQNQCLNVSLPSADQKKVIQNIQNSKNSYLTSMYEGTGKVELTFDYEVNHIPLDSITLPTDAEGNPVIRRSGENLYSVDSITIHSTANPNSYSDGERNWLINSSNYRTASFHIVVDENKALEVIPLDEVAIHASDYLGNRTSIGIEICHSGDREQTLQNAIVLTAKLLQEYGLDKSNLKRHYDWNGKNCPSVLIDSSIRDREHQTWEWFVDEVDKLLK